MKMELEARDFYRESGDRVARDDVKRLLSRLAKWEESHHRFLKEQRDRLKSGAGWDASAILLDASEARDILERPWKGRGVEPPLSEEASDFSVIRMALGMETDFRNFYLKAAVNTDDPDGKTVLAKLADWEGEHQKIIDEQYRQLHQDFMAQMGFAPF
jgi:rubrerythrin